LDVLSALARETAGLRLSDAVLQYINEDIQAIMKKLLREILDRGRPFFDTVKTLHFGLPHLKKVRCNTCGWEGRKFLNYYGKYGKVVKNAICRSCRSHPRHRYMSMYLRMLLKDSKPLKLLHFAPEISLQRLLTVDTNIDYLSVDADPTRAMQQEDITNLSFADGSFDAIVCLHVLEHVPDDQKAMSELYRILADGGFALLDVPIDYKRATTYENSAVTTPGDREKIFWHRDHVRLYGRDFAQKLEKAGFKVKVDGYISSLSEEVIRYHGLRKNPIYFCTK
jgi:predicted SAM-dependent methyltransferase